MAHATVTQTFMHGCTVPISRDTALEQQQVHQETVTSLLGVLTCTKVLNLQPERAAARCCSAGCKVSLKIERECSYWFCVTLLPYLIGLF